MKKMKWFPVSFALLLGLASCDSKSADGRYNTAEEDVIENQIDSDTKASIDSMAKASPKGNIVFALPDTLTTLLKQRRPQAQMAYLPDQILAQNHQRVKDPTHVSGDFNGDQKRDYAVQVRENDSIYVLAYMDYAGQGKEVKVASYPAQKLDDGWYSLYQLRLAPKDSVVLDYRNQQKRPLGKDGVSIIEQERTILYVFKDGRFIPFDQQK